MPAGEPVTLYKFFIYIFFYVLLLCISVYQYYYGYYLLESGVVLQYAIIVSVLFLVAGGFFFRSRVKPIIAKVNAGGWLNYLYAMPAIIFIIALLSFLLVGCIAVINSSIGPQHHFVLNAMLVNANRETGRGGMNAQFYYKFYHFDSIGVYKNYVLRSPNRIYFEKNVHLELTKGSLGILYEKE